MFTCPCTLPRLWHSSMCKQNFMVYLYWSNHALTCTLCHPSCPDLYAVFSQLVMYSICKQQPVAYLYWSSLCSDMHGEGTSGMCERFEYRCLSLYVNQPWWTFPKLSNPTSNLVLSCCLASHSQSKYCSVQLIDTLHNATSVKEQTTYLVVDRSCVTLCGCDVLQRCAICMKLMCHEARNKSQVQSGHVSDMVTSS